MNKIVMIVLSMFLSTGVYSSLHTDLNDFFNQLEKAEKREDIKKPNAPVMNLKAPKPLFTRQQLRNIKLKTIDVPSYKPKDCSDFDSIFNQCKAEFKQKTTPKPKALEKTHE